MVSLILAIAGIIVGFVSPILGLILIVISLVFGIIGMKKKEKYAKAGAIISSIVLVLNIVIMMLGFNHIKKTNDEIKQIWEDYSQETEKIETEQ